MKYLIGIALLSISSLVLAQAKVNPTDPQPTCHMCPGTFIPVDELNAYTKKAIQEGHIDQQVRDIDIGKARVGIGMVYRGKIDEQNHDAVAGSGTLVLGPDITNRQRRPATQKTVVEFNGPGNNGSEILNGISRKLQPGDVVVIPAGTGHWFTEIPDHINYLMIRFDPDKVTPLKSEAQSLNYLSKPASR